MEHRLAKLRDLLIDRGLEVLLITQPENRRYLSSFTGSAGSLFVSRDQAILATDFRYIEQASAQAPDFDIFKIDGSLGPYLKEILSRLGAQQMGFEASVVSYSFYEEMAAELADSGVELVPTDGYVETIRAVKDSRELEAIQRATEATDAAFERVSSALEVGMTEKQVAWELDKCMREHGAEGLAFETIVGSGPNSALPHARPGDRLLAAGEPIVIDMGAKVAGYCSDLTRTIILGEPTVKFQEIYSIVLAAQLAAINSMRAGMTGKEADALARDSIIAAGYGNEFGHSLGHGIGLAAHEMPWVRRTNTDLLAEGMVTSIEPGIYLPGWGGVRIEDLAIVREARVDIITRSRKLGT